ncbi:MAG TPA: dephospho-CoA kinase [Acetivibrio sp.]|nr:dephospho-CoA kinase [Clostridium sp.]HOQ36418.1 dephospho-CoA kinase [Acetivibrio sp.]HQA56466.1 dephospho-CoA kinase [Acetivibrio sp.]
MKTIGVTGKIGSGKSTVSKILADMGAAVIDADAIYRSITKKGHEVYDELVDSFGDEILDDNGEIDRKKLAAIAFQDEEELKKLNDITHKHIVRVIIDKLNEYKNKEKVVVIDAAIPVEHGFLDVADQVWVVLADKETRINRVMKRSGLTYEQVLERMNSQPGDDYYCGIADVIIQNDGSFEDLKAEVEENFRRFELE